MDTRFPSAEIGFSAEALVAFVKGQPHSPGGEEGKAGSLQGPGVTLGLLGSLPSEGH